MTALVTGASGFVGSAVVRALLERGERVRVLLRPSSPLRNLEGLAVERVHGDLLQPQSLAPALVGCRDLYHVAADYRLWVPDPASLYRVNVEGTVALLRLAQRAGVERIVYTSSVATLGSTPDGRPADERSDGTLAEMVGHYKRSKFMAEEQVRRLAREEGCPAVIVNPSAPVGPRDIRPTPTGRMILDAAAGRTPAYVDTGLNIVHVDDVAAGHLLAAERGLPGERYILGHVNLSLREILELVASLSHGRPPRLRLPHGAVVPVAWLAEGMARLTGREPRISREGLRMARKKMYYSSERAGRELGFRSRPAEAAIADAIAWFRAHGYL